MFSFTAVSHARIGYYFEPEAPGRVPVGRWMGRSSEELGLTGRPVERAGLVALLTGIDPLSGAVLDPRHARVRVAAYEATVTTPKSISLLGTLGDATTRAGVRDAHQAGVDATLEYLERHAAGVRRGKEPGRRKLPADGFVAAAFGHETSRANDPHLHSHVLVANLVRDPAGRWSGLDSSRLFAAQGVAGALYLCHLRYELSRRLDVAFRARPKGGMDLVGLSDGVLWAFSQRSQQIRTEQPRAWRGARAKSIANKMSRPPKDSSLDAASLREQWWERANRLGVSESRLANIARSHPPFDERAHGARSTEATVRDVIAAMPGTFTRQQAVRAAAFALLDGAPVTEVERAVGDALESVAVRDPDHPLVTQHSRPSTGRRIPSGIPEPLYLSAGRARASADPARQPRVRRIAVPARSLDIGGIDGAGIGEEGRRGAGHALDR